MRLGAQLQERRGPQNRERLRQEISAVLAAPPSRREASRVLLGRLNISLRKRRKFFENLFGRISCFQKTDDGGNADARSRYHIRLMRNVPMLLYFSDLLRRPVAQCVGLASHIVHDAADRKKMILTVDNAAKFPRFRLFELNLPFPDIEGQVSPRCFAVRDYPLDAGIAESPPHPHVGVGVAQWLERPLEEGEVGGSRPSAQTIYSGWPQM